MLTVLLGVPLAAGLAVVAPQAAKSRCDNAFVLCMWHDQSYSGTWFIESTGEDHLGAAAREQHPRGHPTDLPGMTCV